MEHPTIDVGFVLVIPAFARGHEALYRILAQSRSKTNTAKTPVMPSSAAMTFR
jgi:hypothetical protein